MHQLHSRQLLSLSWRIRADSMSPWLLLGHHQSGGLQGVRRGTLRQQPWLQRVFVCWAVQCRILLPEWLHGNQSHIFGMSARHLLHPWPVAVPRVPSGSLRQHLCSIIVHLFRPLYNTWDVLSCSIHLPSRGVVSTRYLQRQQRVHMCVVPLQRPALPRWQQLLSCVCVLCVVQLHGWCVWCVSVSGRQLDRVGECRVVEASHSCIKALPIAVNWTVANATCAGLGPGYHLLTTRQVR